MCSWFELGQEGEGNEGRIIYLNCFHRFNEEPRTAVRVACGTRIRSLWKVVSVYQASVC